MGKRTYTKRPTFKELEAMSYSQLRKEYTTMRDIFQKRIKRMSNIGIEAAQPYLEGGYAFIPTIRDLASRRGIQNLGPEGLHRAILMEAKELVNLLGQRSEGRITTGTFSLEGMRQKQKTNTEKILESLQSNGKKHITKSTLKKFGKFMDAMRGQYGKKNPGSEREALWFESLKYDTKRMGLKKIKEMWERYEANNYQPPKQDIDLYAKRSGN